MLIFLISLLPSYRFRNFLYNIAGFNVHSSAKILGPTYISCDELMLESEVLIDRFNFIKARKIKIAKNSKIKKFNYFTNINEIIIGVGSQFGKWNKLIGTRRGLSPFEQHQNFYLKSESIITNEHFFDVSDEISIGSNVTVGGKGTEVWTHSFDLNHVKMQSSVTIGDNIYIGSRVTILPGVGVCNRVSIGAGTVVSKSIIDSGFYISQKLVKKGELKEYGDGATSYNGNKFVRIK